MKNTHSDLLFNNLFFFMGNAGESSVSVATPSVPKNQSRISSYPYLLSYNKSHSILV